MLTKHPVIEHNIFLDYVFYQIVQYLKSFRQQAGKAFCTGMLISL